MTDEPKRRGRPLGKRGTFSFRVTSTLRERLEAAATAAGRPVSEVIETRLEASFHDDDAMRVIRETIRQEMRAEFAARQGLGQEIYRQATAFQGYQPNQYHTSGQFSAQSYNETGARSYVIGAHNLKD